MIDGCPFCDYAGPNMILYEDRDCYVVEPLRQVTPGHVLVIPKQHATDFADSAEVTAKAFRSAAYFAQSEEIEDCNLITSKGASASQTVRHIHVHILPRRWGDNVRLPWGNPNPEPGTETVGAQIRECAAERLESKNRVIDELLEFDGSGTCAL